MATDLYIGRRLSFDGSLCTVRYIGPLVGTKGEWLGVEWDDPSRGKHDGKHRDQQVFQCLSLSSTAASFIKPSRKPDVERTVLEAIQTKYGSSLTDGSTASEIVVISGKVAEEVGFDKIAREQAQLAELRVVLVDNYVVNGLVPRALPTSAVSQAQKELTATCPNITELDLGWNVIETWEDIIYICTALPHLKTLRAGGLRLRSFNHQPQSISLSHVRELHLEDCLLSTEQLRKLLDHLRIFTHLEELHLAGNQLADLTPLQSSHVSPLPSVQTINLDNNLFEDLSFMIPLMYMFPNLRSVSVQGNKITHINLSSAEACSHLQALNVSNNLILSYEFLDSLPFVFPNLSSLRVTSNPLYRLTESAAATDPRASDKSYYLTLARVPSLKTLNYTTITARDRAEGEIYYLSVAEKELANLPRKAFDSSELLGQVQKQHPQYERLCEKHNRDSIIAQNKDSSLGGSNQAIKFPGTVTDEYPPGSLGARLINATFYIHKPPVEDENRPQTSFEIPSSIPVMRLMSLLMRRPAFQNILKPLQFKLIYESKELDPVDTTAESTTRSAAYSRNLTQDQKVALWKEWGDWDADAIMEDALRDNENSNGEIPEKSTDNATSDEHWIDGGKFLMREGRKWKRREVEIPHSLKRPWGDWLDDSKDVTIRIEPFERKPWK